MRGGGDGEFLTPIIHKFGEQDVRSLKQSDIDGLASDLYPDAKSSTRNRRVYTPFIAVMNYAARDGRCDDRRWHRPEQPQGRTDWRTPEEMERILDKLAPNAKRLAIFYLGTFCRATEAIDLDWRDISPAGQRATFWETKGGYARHVDLIPRVRENLPARPEAKPEEDARVFLTDRDRAPWHGYDAMNLALGRACEAAKVKPLSCHVLRHTGATWRYALNKDLTELMKVGGWKTPTMVFRYVHAGTDDLAKAVQAHGWATTKAAPKKAGAKR
jgi:integrase